MLIVHNTNGFYFDPSDRLLPLSHLYPSQWIFFSHAYVYPFKTAKLIVYILINSYAFQSFIHRTLNQPTHTINERSHQAVGGKT